MKRIWFYLLFLFGNTSFAQMNLVPNNSFEDTLNCGIIAGPNVAPPWFNPTSSTPDYFSSNLNCGTNPYLSLVYQIPHTGIAFCGIFCYDTQSEREYLEVPLITALDSGHTYCVEFYVSRANLSKYAIDKIGACFSIDTLQSSNPLYLNVTPQICNTAGNIIYDTLNWTLIQGNFIASGGEKFLTIGNFYDNNSIALDSSSETFDAAYYHVDDVSVYDCTTGIAEVKNKNEIKAYPNPFSKKTYITISNVKILNKKIKVEILNSFSQRIFPSYSINGNEIILESNNLMEGIYYVKIIDSKTTYSIKLIITN